MFIFLFAAEAWSCCNEILKPNRDKWNGWTCSRYTPAGNGQKCTHLKKPKNWKINLTLHFPSSSHPRKYLQHFNLQMLGLLWAFRVNNGRMASSRYYVPETACKEFRGNSKVLNPLVFSSVTICFTPGLKKACCWSIKPNEVPPYAGILQSKQGNLSGS